MCDYTRTCTTGKNIDDYRNTYVLQRDSVRFGTRKLINPFKYNKLEIKTKVLFELTRGPWFFLLHTPRKGHNRHHH